MIVACALPVNEDVIPSTYREAEISSESEMWKKAMLKEINSLQNCQGEEGHWLQVGVCKEARISSWSYCSQQG